MTKPTTYKIICNHSNVEIFSPEEVSSTQKSLASFHDPGWNDPPKWAQTVPLQSSGTPPTKRLLNKRVAFPMSSTSSNQSSNPAQQSPLSMPPPACSLGSTSSPLAPKSSEICEGGVDKEESLRSAWENLQHVIRDLDSSRLEDVQKRLDVMRNLWLEDKLNASIHHQILKLSEGIYSTNTVNIIWKFIEKNGRREK